MCKRTLTGIGYVFALDFCILSHYLLNIYCHIIYPRMAYFEFLTVNVPSLGGDTTTDRAIASGFGRSGQPTIPSRPEPPLDYAKRFLTPHGKLVHLRVIMKHSLAWSRSKPWSPAEKFVRDYIKAIRSRALTALVTVECPSTIIMSSKLQLHGPK